MKLDQAGIENLFRSGLIVFIDGECHLCHGFVQFVLRREAEPRARFAALQDFLPELRRRFPEYASRFNAVSTIVVLDEGRLYFRSAGVLRVARTFRGVWRIFAIMAGFVPGPLRDLAYDWIAKHRYAWFGKKDRCEWNPGVSRGRILS